MSCITDYETDDARWHAVVEHDAAADGTFFYGVRTTGVYCRPTCPARLARRDNVTYHATSADAEAAGFRPCRRCRPDEAALRERRADAVILACRIIEQADRTLGLGELAGAVGMSRYHFHRVFREITGVTPKAYADARRADRVRTELTTRPTVTDAIYSAGFESSGRFYAAAPSTLGMTPTEYRAGGKGAAIRFGVGQCSLGAVVVAASEAGICAILLGDEPDQLVRDLQDRFPEAELIGGDADFERRMAQVVGLVEAPGVGLDLPLDVRGTAFQRRVWEALREVPAGTTTTYSHIAERIGAPKAVRAVAQACGANNLAVAIPCHRVVRTDGGLSGYRWGVERKRALLEREAVG
jgi:AraC family transcriptional regulator, regulatory protein of adaptative response / methylated-DNA-[protein]-cysteine methyltransferase